MDGRSVGPDCWYCSLGGIGCNGRWSGQRMLDRLGGMLVGLERMLDLLGGGMVGGGDRVGGYDDDGRSMGLVYPKAYSHNRQSIRYSYRQTYRSQIKHPL